MSQLRQFQVGSKELIQILGGFKMNPSSCLKSCHWWFICWQRHFYDYFKYEPVSEHPLEPPIHPASLNSKTPLATSSMVPRCLNWDSSPRLPQAFQDDYGKRKKLKSNAQVNLGIFKSSSLEHQMFRVNPPLRNKRAKPHQCFPSLGRPRLIEDAIGNRIVLLHRMCKRENDLRTTGLFLRGNRLAGHTTVVTYPWCAIMRLGNSSQILRSLTALDFQFNREYVGNQYPWLLTVAPTGHSLWVVLTAEAWPTFLVFEVHDLPRGHRWSQDVCGGAEKEVSQSGEAQSSKKIPVDAMSLQLLCLPLWRFRHLHWTQGTR